MDYGSIINNAFRVAWQQKSLWVFGLFASGGAIGALQLSIDEDWEADLGAFGKSDIDFGQIFEAMPWLAPALVLVVLALIVTHILLGALCQPALIDAVNRLTRGGQYRFSHSLSVGVDLMWRTLGVMVLEALTGFGAFILLLVVGILLGILFAAIHGLLVIPVVMAGLVAAFGIVFAVVMIFGLGYRALTVRRTGVLDAINEGAVLFRRHTLSCLAIFAIFIVFWIMLVIIITIIALVVGMPLYLLAQSLDIGFVPALLAALPIIWAVMLPLNGFLGTALDAAFTLFYFQLLEPQQAVAAPYGTQPGPAIR